MRPPHNTMGPGMPGVNMWVFFICEYVLSLKDFHPLTISKGLCRSYPLGARGPVGHGPIPTMPTLWVLMTHTNTQTHAYTPRNGGSGCRQISCSRCGRGLMCSKVLVWDVIVVLCVTVSTEGWTDGHNGVRLIKWWMMTFWGIENGLHSHSWSVMFVLLVSDALLITLSRCIWGESTSWRLNSSVLQNLVT